MKKIHNTGINKENGDYFTDYLSDNSLSSYVDMKPDNNVPIDNPTESRRNEHAATNSRNNIETLNNNDLETQNNSHNKYIIKPIPPVPVPPVRDCLSFINCAVKSNNSNEKQNDALSYINEFDLFLKKYKDNYDSYNNAYNTTITEMEDIVNDINELEDLKQIDGCKYSLNLLSAQTGPFESKENDIKKDIEDNTCKLSVVENIVTSEAQTIKPLNSVKTEIQLNKDNIHLVDVDDKKDFTIIQENEHFISDPSQNIYSSINPDHIDQPLDYQISSLNNTEIDVNVKFVVDSDSDEYNSSDFEFINEQEACLGGIINKSHYNIKLANFAHGDTNHSINFNEPGPSGIFSKLEIKANNEFDPDNDCDGYNSSDFEFIDEQEASLQGIIYNKSSFGNLSKLIHNIQDQSINFPDSGPSRVKDESRSPLKRFDLTNDPEEFGNNHLVPAGEHLYELFAEPWSVFECQAENKAFFSNKAMNLDVSDIGFNVQILDQGHQEYDVDDVFKQEAIENTQKILMMYPVENEKRTRRFC